MDLSAALLCESVDGLCEGEKDMRRARLDDGVHGVQPQSIETVVAQPMQCIFDCKDAHLRNAIIDCCTPRGLVRLGEKRRRNAVEMISFGSEVIRPHPETSSAHAHA